MKHQCIYVLIYALSMKRDYLCMNKQSCMPSKTLQSILPILDATQKGLSGTCDAGTFRRNAYYVL